MSTSQIEAYLDEVKPYEFEEFVADLWEKYGFNTEVTSGSQDRGIDIKAEKETPVKQKVLIQAKAYSKENKVDSYDVDKYQILYRQEDDIDKVVIITTGSFTCQAKQKAQDLDIEAIDREKLVELITNTGMEVPNTDSEASHSPGTEDTDSEASHSSEAADEKYDSLGEPSGTDFVDGTVKVDDPTVLERQRLKTTYHELRRARGNTNNQAEKNKITKRIKEIEEQIRESK